MPANDVLDPGLPIDASQRSAGRVDQICVSQVDPISDPRWDSWLAQRDGASIFHTSHWLELMRRCYGYVPCGLVAHKGDDWQAAIPWLEVRSVWTGRRGISLPFTDFVPPLAVPGFPVEMLFQSICEKGRQRGWRYYESRSRLLAPTAPSSQAFLGHSVPLLEDAEELMSRCESSVRRAIRKGQKDGVRCSVGTDTGLVREFYALHCKTRRKHGVPPQSYRFFRLLQERVLGEGHGRVIVAHLNGTPIAGAVFLHYKREAIYKYGASDPAFQSARGSNAVMWHAIQGYGAEAYRELNLGRSARGDEGLRRFKLGWGAREFPLEYLRYDLRHSEFVQVPDRARDPRLRIFQRLPVVLNRMIGALVYRHVA